MRKNGVMNPTDTKYRFQEAVHLTQELANGMPIYPGNPVPSFESYRVPIRLSLIQPQVQTQQPSQRPFPFQSRAVLGQTGASIINRLT